MKRYLTCVGLLGLLVLLTAAPGCAKRKKAQEASRVLTARQTYELAQQAMRERKAAIFDHMVEEYRSLREGGAGISGYDRWFAQRPNNAQIASVAIYTQLVPVFQSLLAAEGGDLGRFYARVKALAELPKEKRAEVLKALPRGPAGG